MRVGRDGEAVEALLQKLEEGTLDGASNPLDVLRDKIYRWSVANWGVLRYIAACPLQQNQEACRNCSDGMVVACYAINKQMIEGEKDVDSSRDDEEI